MSYQNILAVVNKKENYLHTVAKAYQLAEKSSAKVTFLIVDSQFERLSYLSKVQRIKAQQLQQKLIEAIETHNQHGNLLTIKSCHALKEHRGVEQELKNHEYDLVVKDKKAHQAYVLGFSLTQDRSMLRHVNVPVLLVTDQQWLVHGDVLAALETEEASECHQLFNKHLLKQGSDLSLLLDSNIHLLNCYMGENLSMSINNHARSNSIKGEKRQHWQHLVDLSKNLNGMNKKLHLKQGLPDEIIPELASQFKVNLVVVGSGEHKGLVNNMLGHTSEYVIDKLNCDVLAVSAHTEHYH